MWKMKIQVFPVIRRYNIYIHLTAEFPGEGALSNPPAQTEGIVFQVYFTWKKKSAHCYVFNNKGVIAYFGGSILHWESKVLAGSNDKKHKLRGEPDLRYSFYLTIPVG